MRPGLGEWAGGEVKAGREPRHPPETMLVNTEQINASELSLRARVCGPGLAYVSLISVLLNLNPIYFP